MSILNIIFRFFTAFLLELVVDQSACPEIRIDSVECQDSGDLHCKSSHALKSKLASLSETSLEAFMEDIDDPVTECLTVPNSRRASRASNYSEMIDLSCTLDGEEVA